MSCVIGILMIVVFVFGPALLVVAAHFDTPNLDLGYDDDND